MSWPSLSDQSFRVAYPTRPQPQACYVAAWVVACEQFVTPFAGCVIRKLFISTKPTHACPMFWTEAAVLNAFARAALPDAAEDGGWACRCMTGIAPSSCLTGATSRNFLSLFKLDDEKHTCNTINTLVDDCTVQLSLCSIEVNPTVLQRPILQYDK